MAAKNDITGDSIKSKALSPEGRKNYDNIFRKMNTIPANDKLQNINQYGSLDQLQILKDICNKIYIARNISLTEDAIHDMLKRIDILFSDRNNFN